MQCAVFRRLKAVAHYIMPYYLVQCTEWRTCNSTDICICCGIQNVCKNNESTECSLTSGCWSLCRPGWNVWWTLPFWLKSPVCDKGCGQVARSCLVFWFMGLEVSEAASLDLTGDWYLFLVFCGCLWLCGVISGWCCVIIGCTVGGRPVSRPPAVLSPPRLGAKDFPFSPKRDWMLIAVCWLYYGLTLSHPSRAGNDHGPPGRGDFGWSGPGPLQPLRSSTWQHAQRAGSSHGPSQCAAENHYRPADSYGTGRCGWQYPPSGTQCHRSHPDGVGLEDLKAGRGIDGYRPNGGEPDFHISSGTCSNTDGQCAHTSGQCARRKWCFPSKEGEDLICAGPNRRDGNSAAVTCRDGQVLRQPPGNHGCRAAPRSRTYRSTDISHAGEGHRQGRESIWRLCSADPFRSQNAKGHEGQGLFFPTGRLLEKCGGAGSTELPGLDLLLPCVQGDPLHAEISENSSTVQWGDAQWWREDCTTHGCPATLHGTILRGIPGVVHGVSGSLAPSHDGRRPNERGKVRLSEETATESARSRKGTSGCPVRPECAMGWGLSGSCSRPPVLGLKRQTPSSGVPGENGQSGAASTGTHLRRSQGFSSKHRSCAGSKARGEVSWSKGKEEEERYGGRRRTKENKAGRKEVGDRGQGDQQKPPQEVGRHVPFHSRRKGALLRLVQRVFTGLMPGALQEWQSTQVPNLLGIPPKPRVSEGASKGKGQRHEEIGGSAWKDSAGVRNQHLPRRSISGQWARSQEVPLPRVVRRACWIFRRSQTEVQGECRGGDGTGLLDHQLGHLGGQRLRKGQKMGERSGPRSFCAAMQILHKSKKKGQVWVGPNLENRREPQRMGTPTCRRRKQGRRKNSHFDGRGLRGRCNHEHGKPLRLLSLGTDVHGEACEKNEESGTTPVRVRGRSKETYGHLDGRSLDGRGQWVVSGSSGTSAPARRPVRKDFRLLAGPTGGGLEDITGFGVSDRTMLGLGNGVKQLLAKAGSERLAESDHNGSHCHYFEAVREGTASASGQVEERRERTRKPEGHWRPERPIQGCTAQWCSLESGCNHQACLTDSDQAGNSERRKPSANRDGFSRIQRKNSGRGGNCSGKGNESRSGGAFAYSGELAGSTAESEQRRRRRRYGMVKNWLSIGNRQGTQGEQSLPDHRRGHQGSGRIKEIPIAHGSLWGGRPGELQILRRSRRSSHRRAGQDCSRRICNEVYFLGGGHQVSRRWSLLDAPRLHSENQTRRVSENPIGGGLQAFRCERTDDHQAESCPAKSQRGGRVMGRHDESIWAVSHGIRSGRFSRCLLPMPPRARRKKACRGQSDWDHLLHLRSGSIWSGMWPTAVVQTGRSASEVGTSCWMGPTPTAVLCRRPGTLGQCTKSTRKVDRDGATAVALAIAGMQAQLEQVAERKHHPVDRLSVATHRGGNGGHTGSGQGHEAANHTGRTVRSQRSDRSAEAEECSWLAGVADVNSKACTPVGRHDLGKHHRVRSQTGENGQGPKEPCLFETSGNGAQNPAETNCGRTVDSHLPLGTQGSLDNPDGCLSARLWRHTLERKPGSDLVGRFHRAVRPGLRRRAAEGPCMAVRVGADGSGDLSAGLQQLA